MGVFSAGRRSVNGPIRADWFAPMRVAVFSANPFEVPFLEEANREGRHELVLFESRLDHDTAKLANGFPAVSGFVSDDFSAPVLEILRSGGTGLIALRSAGFNHVDLVRVYSGDRASRQDVSSSARHLISPVSQEPRRSPPKP